MFKRFSPRPPQNLLDIRCGTRSHAIVLAKPCCNVTGIDSSEIMIEKARKNAEKQRARIDFVVEDMWKMRLGKEFNCAICMFGSFGYILTYYGLLHMCS
jgi:ubiquinone/menaquinone biosynthesis C-methylase UbiE